MGKLNFRSIMHRIWQVLGGGKDTLAASPGPRSGKALPPRHTPRWQVGGSAQLVKEKQGCRISCLPTPA